MARERSRGKSCCLSILLTLVIIVVVIAAGVIVLLNLTPNKVKLGDKVVYDEKSLNEIGLGDTKFKEIIKGLYTLTNAPDEGDIIKNPYDPSTEENVAKNLLGVSNDYNYYMLLGQKVTYSVQKQLSYSNTTLGYIFNEVVQNATEGDLALLKEAGVTIKEISFKVDKSGEYAKLKIIGSFSVPDEFKIDPTGKLIKIPEKIYIVSNLTFTVNSDGIIETTPKSISLNSDEENDVSNALIALITNKVVEQTGADSDKAKDGAEILNDSLGSAFSAVIGNLGLVGSGGSLDSSGHLYGATYGMTAVSDNIITVITHKKGL